MAMPQTETHEPTQHGTAMSRALVLTYGIGVYGFFLATFLYMIGFIVGAVVPKNINDGVVGTGVAGVAINALLLGLFAIQHTIMARPAFKRWWIQYIPAAAERSTFVAITSAILCLMVWQWRPFPDVVWQVEGAGAIALWALSATGWGIVLLSTFLIDHFELFGLKQTISYGIGRTARPSRFTERFLYRYVRHPLMLGFLIAFWATPTMTEGHLLFAVLSTGYIGLGLIIEERTLVELHGESYEDYQRRVPKIFPRLARR